MSCAASRIQRVSSAPARPREQGGQATTPIPPERPMSNALAIAAVTATLVQLLQDNIGTSGVTGAHVAGLAPDGAGPMPNPGFNVFLHQVTPNTAYRNADLPPRGPDGSLKK